VVYSLLDLLLEHKLDKIYMTVISALLKLDLIVVSSDSIISSMQNGKRIINPDSYRRPKFVSYPQLRCVAAYWGIANIKVDSEIVWETYDWLYSKGSLQSQFDSLESFGQHLKDDLLSIFNKYNIKNRGIGIHLSGFEDIDGSWVPEMFLISNYTSTDYQHLGQLEYSRRTYLDSYPDRDFDNIPINVQRIQYLADLRTGSYSLYNNGDPIMFNNYANAYQQAIKNAGHKGILKGGLNRDFYIEQAKNPIKQVALFQRKYYIKESIVVGGKIHAITMDSTGKVENV
jgi:hypothetical protein